MVNGLALTLSYWSKKTLLGKCDCWVDRTKRFMTKMMSIKVIFGVSLPYNAMYGNSCTMYVLNYQSRCHTRRKQWNEGDIFSPFERHLKAACCELWHGSALSDCQVHHSYHFRSDHKSYSKRYCSENVYKSAPKGSEEKNSWLLTSQMIEMIWQMTHLFGMMVLAKALFSVKQYLSIFR